MRSNPFPAIQTRNENVEYNDSPRALLQGLQQKRKIITELIDGHMPLMVAAAQFEAAHQVTTVCFQQITGVPAPTDSESICRMMIGWVHLELSDRPEQAERISEKLERELQGYLQQSVT